MEAILFAILKALLRQFPGLTLAAILAELDNFKEKAVEDFLVWFKEAQSRDHEWPGPRVEFDDSGTPTGYYIDAEGHRIHMTQG
jgi:hypothetical protein